MKKQKIISVITVFVLLLAIVPAWNLSVSAAYSDGDIIFSENFDGKKTSDINYNTEWFTGDRNFMSYTVEDGALSITTGNNSKINYIELVSAEKLGNQTKYTIQMDIMPVRISNASHGVGIAIHTAFPADATQKNDYDSFVFRDYSANAQLTFSRYKRDDGKAVSAKDICTKGTAGTYNEWYNVRIEVDGANVKVYFNGSTTPVVFTDSYEYGSPIYLVSTGAGDFRVDNVKVWAGVGVEPNEKQPPDNPGTGDGAASLFVIAAVFTAVLAVSSGKKH